jgi:hypothetical protein
MSMAGIKLWECDQAFLTHAPGHARNRTAKTARSRHAVQAVIATGHRDEI